MFFMYKHVAIFVVLFSVSSAQAGMLGDFGRWATGQVFSRWVSAQVTAKMGVGLAATIVTRLSTKAADDAVIQPVFCCKGPSVDVKGLCYTAATTTATEYAVPAMTHGAMYLLGVSAMSNPYTAVLLGLVSRMALSAAVG
jgi:hypothetical protein